MTLTADRTNGTADASHLEQPPPSLGLVDSLEAIARRFHKAKDIVMRGLVIHAPDIGQQAKVYSETDPAKWYLVSTSPRSCTCRDFNQGAKNLAHLCKHVLALALVEKHQMRSGL